MFGRRKFPEMFGMSWLQGYVFVGKCSRSGCSQALVLNPRTGTLHDHCSLRCLRMDQLEKMDQQGWTLTFMSRHARKNNILKKKHSNKKNIIIVCGTWKYFVMCQVISPSLVNVVNKMKKMFKYLFYLLLIAAFVSTPCIFFFFCLYLFWLNEIFFRFKILSILLTPH